MEKTSRENREYASKREYAMDLFKEGWSREDVAELLEITYNTSKTYYQQYKKELGLVKERAVKNITQENNIEKYEIFDTVFEIGNTLYTINYYKEEDGSIWFNLIEIVEALKEEDILNVPLSDINIPARYLKNEVINGSLVNMIDKNALVDFAQTIGDHTLIMSIMTFLSNDFDYFCKFASIVNSFDMMEKFLNGIDDRYTEIRAFNDCQSDILHEIDNDNAISMEKKLERYERLENIRLARRATKNELVLSQTLRGLFKYHNANARNINFMSVKLNQTLKALYNKNYNSRVEQLDDMQRELIDKVVQKY